MYFSWHGTGIRQKAMTKKLSINKKTSQDTECIKSVIPNLHSQNHPKWQQHDHHERALLSLSRFLQSCCYQRCIPPVPNWSGVGEIGVWPSEEVGHSSPRKTFAVDPPTIIFQGRAKMRIFLKSNFQPKKRVPLGDFMSGCCIFSHLVNLKWIAHHPSFWTTPLKTREFQAALPSTLFLLFATRATVHGHSKPVPGSYLRSTGPPCHHWVEASSWFRYATNVGTTAFLWKIPQNTYGHNEKNTQGPWLRRVPERKVCQEKDSTKLGKHNSNHFNHIPKSLRFFTIVPFSQKTKVSKVLLSTKGHS